MCYLHYVADVQILLLLQSDLATYREYTTLFIRKVLLRFLHELLKEQSLSLSRPLSEA